MSRFVPTTGPPQSILTINAFRMSIAGSRFAELPARWRTLEWWSSLAEVTPSTRGRPGGSELADEQAAVRRVATLVAQHAPACEVFAAIAREAGQLLGVDATHMGRYEDREMVTV